MKKNPEINYLIVVFHHVLALVCISVSFDLANGAISMSIPPSNIKRNLIYQTINRHDLEYICEREWVLVLRMVCHGKKDDNDSEIKPQACTEISYE